MTDNTVTITGNYPIIERKRTGLFSLDVALSDRGKLGYPMRTITEIFGYAGCGKSTLSYYLAARLSENGRVVICDLEALDRDYIEKTFKTAGFDGEVRLIDVIDEKGKPETHSSMLTNMRNEFFEEGTKAVIWDSIAAVVSDEEAKGDFGEANWGRRAKICNQVSRSLESLIKQKSDSGVVFGINHVQQIMGGKGHDTPGGGGFKYASAVRMMLWTAEKFTVSDTDLTPIGFLVSGKIEKGRYGGAGRKFNVYIIPGYGVHEGATAMFDAIDLGLAERKAVVKMNEKSLGYLNKDLLSYAYNGKKRKFYAFQEEIEKHESEMIERIAQGETDEDM